MKISPKSLSSVEWDKLQIKKKMWQKAFIQKVKKRFTESAFQA